VNDIAKEQNFVRKLYRDILNGFSVFYLKEKSFSFRHLSEVEVCSSNEVYIKEFDKAKMQGLLSAEDKIKLLCRDKVWSEEKEAEIQKLSDQIITLQNTIKKLVIKSQVNKVKNDLKEKENLLKNIIKERDELLGLTADNFAYKKSNEYIIYSSLYESDGKTPMFKQEDEFAELNEVDLIEYIQIYKEFINNFKIDNIKKIAVSPFFMNTFFLCEDDPFLFFGKPVVNLTQYQCDLFSLARNYKYYLSKSGENPPANVKSLGELVSWYENRQIISNLKEKDSNKMGQSYVGASKEELKLMTSNSKDEVVDLAEEAKKAGGNLSFDQILKIHGV
jgi:hypothetical protein